MRVPAVLSIVLGLLFIIPAAIHGEETGGPTPAEQLRQAEQLRKDLKWDAAIPLLREVVNRRTEDPDSAAMAQARLGKCLMEIGYASEAEVELQYVDLEFGAQREAIEWSQLYLTELMQRRGDLVGAETSAQTLLSTASTPEVLAWARLKLAEIPLFRNSASQAVAALEEAIATATPDYPEPANWGRVRLIQALGAAWSFDRTKAVCDAVVADHATGMATDEQVALALLCRGRALIQSRDYEQAIAPLEMAIGAGGDRHPELAQQADFALGEAARNDDDHEAALAYYYSAFERATSAELPDSTIDWARLQVGSEMRNLGMRERGIAWLRMGIEDPADLSETDRLLAERLASFLTDEEAETWQHYMLSPAQGVDPTGAFVRAEFGEGAPPPSSVVVNRPFRRLYWLGRLYLDQSRYDEALGTFEQAKSYAQSSVQQAEALVGQLKVFGSQAEEMREQGQRKEAYKFCRSKRTLAEQTTEMWLEIAMSGSAGDAHYAIEEAIMALRALRLNKDALRAADRFVDELTNHGADRSKIAFARLFRARALGLWNYRPAEAAKAALELADELSADDDLNLETICVHSLLDACLYHAGAGEPFAGLAILDEVKETYPGKYTDWIEFERRKVSDNYLSIDGSDSR